jgi:hypothetical protein
MLKPRLRAFFDACFSGAILSPRTSEPETPPSVISMTAEEIQASRQERLRGLTGAREEAEPE